MIGKVALAMLAAIGAVVLSPMLLSAGVGLLSGVGVIHWDSLWIVFEYGPYVALAVGFVTFVEVLRR